jgi:hypothetical protein
MAFSCATLSSAIGNWVRHIPQAIAIKGETALHMKARRIFQRTSNQAKPIGAIMSHPRRGKTLQALFVESPQSRHQQSLNHKPHCIKATLFI